MMSDRSQDAANTSPLLAFLLRHEWIIVAIVAAVAPAYFVAAASVGAFDSDAEVRVQYWVTSNGFTNSISTLTIKATHEPPAWTLVRGQAVQSTDRPIEFTTATVTVQGPPGGEPPIVLTLVGEPGWYAWSLGVRAPDGSPPNPMPTDELVLPRSGGGLKRLSDNERDALALWLNAQLRLLLDEGGGRLVGPAANPGQVGAAIGTPLGPSTSIMGGSGGYGGGARYGPGEVMNACLLVWTGAIAYVIIRIRLRGSGASDAV